MKLKRFDEINEEIMLNSKVNDNLEEIKEFLNDYDSHSFPMEYLNKCDEHKLYSHAVYSGLHMIELISRNNDGALAYDEDIDTKILEDMSIQTLNFVSELKDFFEKIK